MNPSGEVHDEPSTIKIIGDDFKAKIEETKDGNSQESEVVSLDDIEDGQPRSLISISSQKGSLVNEELILLSFTSSLESLQQAEEPDSLISISSKPSLQSITMSVESSQPERPNIKCWARTETLQYRTLRFVKYDFGANQTIERKLHFLAAIKMYFLIIHLLKGLRRRFLASIAKKRAKVAIFSLQFIFRRIEIFHISYRLRMQSFIIIGYTRLQTDRHAQV